jgi:hypothetical protein
MPFSLSSWLLPMNLMQETLAATCEVIPLRTSLMASAGLQPGADLPAEGALMVSEKLAAFGAAGQNAQSGLWAIQQHWLTAWTAAWAGGGWPVLMSASTQFSPLLARIAAESLAPVHGRVVANARRLAAPAPVLALESPKRRG